MSNKRGQPNQDDKAVQSIPLDTEDGGKVVIQQQNVGPGNKQGAGKFKRSSDTSVHKTPDQAAAEQDYLERAAPIKD